MHVRVIGAEQDNLEVPRQSSARGVAGCTASSAGVQRPGDSLRRKQGTNGTLLYLYSALAVAQCIVIGPVCLFVGVCG